MSDEKKKPEWFNTISEQIISDENFLLHEEMKAAYAKELKGTAEQQAANKAFFEGKTIIPPPPPVTVDCTECGDPFESKDGRTWCSRMRCCISGSSKRIGETLKRIDELERTVFIANDKLKIYALHAELAARGHPVDLVENKDTPHEMRLGPFRVVIHEHAPDGVWKILEPKTAYGIPQEFQQFDHTPHYPYYTYTRRRP